MTRITDSDTTTRNSSFRQAMAWLHTWAGLTLGWVLFFIFLTGTTGYFDSEIDRWMQPELPTAQTDTNAAETAVTLLQRLKQEAPEAEQWLLHMPVDRNQPYAGISWRGASLDAGASAVSGNLQLNAKTGETLKGRETHGGQQLYQMHWRLHYLSRSYSDWIISFATLFMLVSLITGIIIHKKIFREFFTFRPGKGQRSWLDAHSVLSVVALPFHLMITYSGLVFMGFSFMPLIIAAHYGTDSDARRQFFADVFDPPGMTQAVGEQAPMAPLNGMVAEASSYWGADRIRSIDIRHPGDRNARIIVSENIDQSVSSGGQWMVFDGTNGKLLHTASSATSPAKGARDLLLGLHEGLFAKPLLRWLYFFSGLLGTGMVATGLILWAVKRRQLAERRTGVAHPSLVLVEKLNIGTVAGLPIAIAAYFWANRLLPTGLANRADWEAHCLFLVWLAMLVYASLRSTHRAWLELCTTAALAFGLLPLINALTTNRHLGHSLSAGDWVFAGFDLIMLTLGTVFGCTTWYILQKQKAAARTCKATHAAIREAL